MATLGGAVFQDQETAFKAVRDSAKRVINGCNLAEGFLERYRQGTLKQLTLPADPNVGFTSILLEACATARLVRSLSHSRAANMPTVRLNELNGTISGLDAALSSFNAMSTEIEKDNRPLKFHKNGTVNGQITGEQYYDLGAPISDIFQKVDAVRNATALIGVHSYDPKLETRYEETAGEIARRAEVLRSEIEQMVLNVKSSANEIEQRKAEAEANQSQLNHEFEGQRENFSRITAEAQAAKVAAESARDAIGEVKSTIDGKKSELDQSVAQAETKLEEIASFHSELSAIRAELKGLRTSADENAALQNQYVGDVRALIAEAEAMVSGATNAGLAKAFDEERTRLANGMGWALFSFLVGILCLFLTTILLAAYVFEIPIDLFGYNVGQAGKTIERGDEITLAGVVSRTVILLAPFWLTLFSSRRYRNLFDLRQQYTHKYSMAFSVDGFKQQAPKYSEQMAAWVFHIVAEPPVSAKSSKGMGDNPLPDIQSVVKSQLERFGVLNSDKPAGDGT